MAGRLQRCLLLICATIGASKWATAADLASLGSLPPSAWILDIGGYGLIEPVYEGSRNYTFGFRPQIDADRAGDRAWLTFPNDAVSYALFETGNFRTGPAGTLTLQPPRNFFQRKMRCRPDFICLTRPRAVFFMLAPNSRGNTTGQAASRPNSSSIMISSLATLRTIPGLVSEEVRSNSSQGWAPATKSSSIRRVRSVDLAPQGKPNKCPPSHHMQFLLVSQSCVTSPRRR